MVNTKLFQTVNTNSNAIITNNTGGKAYEMSAKHALSQIISTGCFNDTFYTSAADQLTTIKLLLPKVEPEFLAKLAIYAREKAYMKDTPAVLLAYLATSRSDLFAKVFNRVVDNTKMLRNVVQMIRSGEFGRKSLGTRPKRLIQTWLASKDDKTLFRGSIGNKPSLGDVIKMVHPKPDTESRKALYGYLIGAMTKIQHENFLSKEGNRNKKVSHYDPAQLPDLVKSYEAFKAAPANMLLPPDVSFEMLTALPLNQAQWVQIAKDASWTQTRMNLNTFVRHGVFNEPGMEELVAEKLTNRELINKSKVFPYQLMVASLNVDATLPVKVRDALHAAMEIATENVPTYDGKIFIFLDVSGSMSQPVGTRVGATSKVRCVDVASLFASALLRKNPNTTIIPFEGCVVDIKRCKLSSTNTIVQNAQALASVGGGSTNCAAPLFLLNSVKEKGDLCIFISDNESNVDVSRSYGKTAVLEQWQIFKERNPQAKLVAIDIVPNKTVQAPNNLDIANCGGFSDEVFNFIDRFVKQGNDTNFWVNEIEKINL